jgi:hypothetical protein
MELKVSFVDCIFVGKLLNAEVEANKRVQWSRSKHGRAAACRALEIAPHVIPSIRQQYQIPSDTVLANAFSAVIGAVWLDLESRNESASNTRMRMFSILRQIDQKIADTTNTFLSRNSGANAAVPEGDNTFQHSASGEMPNNLALDENSYQNINSLDVSLLQGFTQSPQPTTQGAYLNLFSLDGTGSELDHISHGNVQSK